MDETVTPPPGIADSVGYQAIWDLGFEAALDAVELRAGSKYRLDRPMIDRVKWVVQDVRNRRAARSS